MNTSTTIDPATIYNLIIAIVAIGVSAFSGWHSINARGVSAAAQKVAETALKAAANASSTVIGHVGSMAHPQSMNASLPNFVPSGLPITAEQLNAIRSILAGTPAPPGSPSGYNTGG